MAGGRVPRRARGDGEGVNKDKYERYHYVLRFSSEAPDGEWLIVEGRYSDEVIVFRHPFNADREEQEPPKEIRDEYERLIEWRPGDRTDDTGNIVEACSDEAGDGFNQACHFGYLVDGHAVYCHNSEWLYSPRKCRRTWYTQGETKDEDCVGFKPREVKA